VENKEKKDFVFCPPKINLPTRSKHISIFRSMPVLNTLKIEKSLLLPANFKLKMYRKTVTLF